MIIERVNGMVVISGVIGGYLVTRKYVGYSKYQAERLFRYEMNHS